MSSTQSTTMVYFIFFYGGLSNENRVELDIMFGGAFMSHTIPQAWKLLDKVRQTRENWYPDLGDVGELEKEYDCIKAYQKTGEVDKVAKKYEIDAKIVLQIGRASCRERV